MTTLSNKTSAAERDFVHQARKLKQKLSAAPISHRVLALALGIRPSSFRVMEAQSEFPWQSVADLADRMPELGINTAEFPQLAKCHRAEQATHMVCPAGVTETEIETFALPSFNARFMDAEMARIGAKAPVADMWGDAR